MIHTLTTHADKNIICSTQSTRQQTKVIKFRYTFFVSYLQHEMWNVFSLCDLEQYRANGSMQHPIRIL